MFRPAFDVFSMPQTLKLEICQWGNLNLEPLRAKKSDIGAIECYAILRDFMCFANLFQSVSKVLSVLQETCKGRTKYVVWNFIHLWRKFDWIFFRMLCFVSMSKFSIYSLDTKICPNIIWYESKEETLLGKTKLFSSIFPNCDSIVLLRNCERKILWNQLFYGAL